MRNVIRSLRQLRPAFQSQDCVLFSVNVAQESPCHFGLSCQIHSSAYIVADHAETNFVKNHSFVTTTRALSTDAAKLTNKGSHFFCSRCAGFRRVRNLFSYVFFVLEFSVSVTETSKAGPLVEYERRIANGELVEGDACQVECLHFIFNA